MIAKVFKSVLKPLMEPLTLADYEKAADAIATAYDASNVGMSMTIFGSILTKGDKETLKQFLFQGLTMNAGLTSYLPVVEPGWTLMANGFCLYWATATFTPLPPMPPIVAPIAGTQVLFPGTPSILDIGLKVAFTQGDLTKALDILSLVLIAHQLTIAGTYNGVLPPPASTPFFMPWAAIIGIPDIELDKKDKGGTSGTAGTSGTSGTSGSAGSAGTSAINPITDQINKILSKINELKKLNQYELKNKKNEIDSLLSDVNKLLTNPNVIASNDYQRVIEALSELTKLK